ncbi:hypothetical protein [Taibaiella soli]|uniref:hypothetical protein n=1 Tax=Taibaiella soli TaxID=1649169 RepID=UPI000F4F0BA0|nr:hypothetical protein [Taibaiella soli]
MKSKNWIVLGALLLAGLCFNSISSEAQVRVTAILPAPPLPPLPPPPPVPVVVAPAPVYYDQPVYYARPRGHYHYDHRRPRGYYYRATYTRPCRSNYYHGRGEWHSNGHRDNGHHYGHRH